MEIEIKNKKENPVLERNEVSGEITFTGATPSNNQLKEELAKKVGAKAELVAVKKIEGKFGGGKASFDAVIYSSKEQFEKIEPKSKKAEEKPAEGAAAPAAAPAPAKAEEKSTPKKEEAPKKEEKAPEKKAEKPAEKEEAPKKEEKPAEKKPEKSPEAPKAEAK